MNHPYFDRSDAWFKTSVRIEAGTACLLRAQDNGASADLEAAVDLLELAAAEAPSGPPQ